MTARTEFSVLDLLDLPVAEREVFLELSRNGPLDAAALSHSLRHSLDEIQTRLMSLEQKGRVRFLPDGKADVQMGHTRVRATLPAQLWTALLAPQRFYSEQEIAILKTAIPMLQFVRATLSSFADHGPHHALRVKTYATQLAYIMELTETERRVLRIAALFHDIGNVLDRDRHHEISQDVVGRLVEMGRLPLAPEEAGVIGLLSRWHRKAYDPERVDTIRGERVRTGLAASILRVADAMDIDSRRSDYDEQYRFAMEFFFPEKRPYFTSLEEVYGVRALCTPSVNIQVFTRGVVRGNMQIEQLYNDLSKTPLDWSVQEISIPVPEQAPARTGRALVVFPFDPHSLIMAALSRRQLERAGYTVEWFCYPDTPDGSLWLWRDALGEMDAAEIQELVIIGDRPDPNITVYLLGTLDRWQAAGVRVNILNRHETNWARIPQLRARGVRLTLGTDWAYFWGDTFTHEEFEWAVVAALITRDPTMATTHVSVERQQVMQGLLGAVLDGQGQAEQRRIQNTAGWVGLAEPLLERIAASDRAFFAARADEFVKCYATATHAGRVQGRVLVFEDAPGITPQSFYWIMEQAMEQQGVTFERGLRLNVPYAVATRTMGDQVELVAMNHWRADHITPVRLLYPDVGPPPQGTESTVTAQLSRVQAEVVVAKLVDACNTI